MERISLVVDVAASLLLIGLGWWDRHRLFVIVGCVGLALTLLALLLGGVQ